MIGYFESREYIYESPDCGRTVYRRKIGESVIARELIIQKELEILDHKQLQDIIELSKSNASLKKALDNLVLIYYTIKDDKNTS
jgi:hypothetical protein